MEFEGEFRYNKKWNGKGYDENGNIIYELINGNGKVKEYNDWHGELNFEGEYLNGKKNGKGKEYNYKNPFLYEGEYLNNKKHGKGKEYDKYGNLIYEGEYLQGERWNGKGKEYNLDDELIYDGIYLNGKKQVIKNIK